nr:hypothetical protein [Tanacetum cinerariifolium]
MSLEAHLLSVEIRKEVPKVPELSLKLDGGVSVRVSNEGATMYAMSWLYWLELVESRDEDIKLCMLLAIC